MQNAIFLFHFIPLTRKFQRLIIEIKTCFSFISFLLRSYIKYHYHFFLILLHEEDWSLKDTLVDTLCIKLY